MPCDSGYMRPSYEENASRIVKELIREVSGEPFDHKNPKGDYYGNVKELDADVQFLCDWCTSNANKISSTSLELQIWWRDHQEADRIRQKEEAAAQKKAHIRAQGLAKLTLEERRALGLK